MTIKPKGGIEYRYERGGAPKLADGKLSGRAAPFNSPTMIGKKPWGFRETIAKGAFAKTLKDGDVVLLDNHDHAKPIARQSADTLAMAETKGGLDWDAVPADTTYANDVRENAKAKNYGGCSFGFEVIRDTWHYNKDDDVDERTLLEVRLIEISVCTFPAYADGTSVTARDMVDSAMEAREKFYEREYGDWVQSGISEDDERDGKSPYGNVAYADPGYQKDGKKRYPIDTKAHAKAAWSYINKVKNAGAYTAKQLSAIKSKIKAACKKFGVKVSKVANGMGKNSASYSGDKRKSNRRKNKNPVNVKGGRKVIAKVRGVAFDESRADEPARQLAMVRQILLKDLVAQSNKKVKRSNTPAKSIKGGNSVGTCAFNDCDSDDPVCGYCKGSGVGPDGVAQCAGGCAGTGHVAGPGDNKGGHGTDAGDDTGDPKDSSAGLGLDKGAHKGSNVPTDGTHSKKTSGEHRKHGQPDTSTDPEGDDDTARRMRAVARAAQMRREQSDAEAEGTE